MFFDLSATITHQKSEMQISDKMLIMFPFLQLTSFPVNAKGTISKRLYYKEK